MSFCWCTIAVNDMEKSLKFYQEILKLPINRRFKSGPDSDVCFLGDGETKVELICGTAHKAPGKVEGISLGFEVKSVDEMINFIKRKGIEVESGPFQPNPHIKFFFIKDPNGVSIQLVENM